MKTIGASLLLIMLLAPLTFAAEIYGTIEVIGGSNSGLTVEIQPISKKDRQYSTTTDKYGSYSADVVERGRCNLKVKMPNGSYTTEIEVYSYENPQRYDLVVENKNGQYVLRRR